MQDTASGELIEAIYDAALDPASWHRVMRGLRQRFGANMEALYFLDFAPRTIRLVHLGGVAQARVRDFTQFYFQPDNPWARYTTSLHRPGLVRTAERLAAFTGDPDILWRSTYYNEWMRPQYFHHTIGTTPYAERGVVANISLFRPGDMPAFSDKEVADFEQLARHFQRALQVGLRLDAAAQNERIGLAGLDALADGVAVVDGFGRLQHANPVFEALLHVADALRLSDGVLHCTEPASDSQFAAQIASAASLRPPPWQPMRLRRSQGESLTLRAMPVRLAASAYLSRRTHVLLIVDVGEGRATPTDADLRKRHNLTPAEARLTRALAEGVGLREAADRCGIGYGTARGYLKAIFQKTGTRRQSELVARLLAESRP